ncbi:MAG: GNAT family N-acetyltransferase [Desulfovibrionaceae bacterium]|nr:GNAT family N-acetyltransferase [Desulfovibrionaceae bacterium]
MELEYRSECAGVDWARVAEILRRVGMAHHAPEVHRAAFEASYATVFVYDGDVLAGFGRAISDGAYQAAIYDCAVLPECQGRGAGRRIVEALLARVGHCNVILYAAPGKEGFYERLGFRRMRTGMARFVNADALRERGFTD